MTGAKNQSDSRVVLFTRPALERLVFLGSTNPSHKYKGCPTLGIAESSLAVTRPVEDVSSRSVSKREGDSLSTSGSVSVSGMIVITNVEGAGT